MSTEKNIKERIIREVESLPASEQLAVLGIIENYIHNKVDETEWDQIPETWKQRITESLLQSESGQLTLHEDAVIYLRKKYGLHG